MFLAYKTDVNVQQNSSTTNYVVIGTSFLFFLLLQLGISSPESLALRSFDTNLLSYGFVQANWFQLLFNMFYLWLFGNTVCSVVGNVLYPALYISLTIISGVVHLLFSGNPLIGASGAIYGIIGCYFFLFPMSRIKCTWTNPYSKESDFYFKAYLIIGLWFLVNILGAIFSKRSLVYIDQMGGFIAGVIISWLMCKYRWIEPIKGEKNLFEILGK
ncbi:MAG: rhomboid family intramembrane serine protease [Gammaproteobacteria bacterium]|nr:MAG: rhomboid family intramembrane serine protease [Gammaproteobacteria bacterium]